jgi:hypothetical protein
MHRSFPRRRGTAAVRTVRRVADARRGGRSRRLVGLVSSGLRSLLGRRPERREAAPDVAYRPRADGRPDPGEIVWTWVPYDEGDGRGKDRPVLVIGRRGADLLGLLLSSQDHDRDAADEARWGRHWMDVGTGGWDSQGRPSEVRLDRLIRLERDGVRREGAALDETIFTAVVEARRGLSR